MAVKKSELYSSLWASCDALRGGMDASQYKDYILTLLFVKYVSDKFTGQDYADIEIPEGGSFADILSYWRSISNSPVMLPSRRKMKVIRKRFAIVLQ